MPQHYVDIISYEGENVVKSLGPYESKRLAEKAERGLSYQLDYSRFYSQTRQETS
jgi:hypothetical protein